MTKMEQEDKHSLLQPLRPFFSPSSSAATTTTTFTAATSTSSYSLPNTDQHHHENDPCNNDKFLASGNNIILRIFLVLLVAAISIWANYEASKTFNIVIVNHAKDTPAGQRFDLSYVSNDRATRIVLNTSSFVQHLLYPQKMHHPKKKHIHLVTLRLSSRNLKATAAVAATGNHHSGDSGGSKNAERYVIDISPSLLEDSNYNKNEVVATVQRAMARVWLWDGESRAPPGLVDGKAEYITELAGFRRERVSGSGGHLRECEVHGWWVDKDPRNVASYLHYCEGYKKGFIQRLNQAMRDTWHDHMVDDVLGMPAKKLCGLYNASWLHNSSEIGLV